MTIEEMELAIGRAYAKATKRQAEASSLVKVVFLSGFSAVAGVAQFAALQRGETLTPWNIAGIGSAILVFLGGIYLAARGKDLSQELELARSSVVTLRDREREIDEKNNWVDVIVADLHRATDLYHGTLLMRGALEYQMSNGSGVTEDELVELLVKVSEDRNLSALGFSVGAFWTFGIYKAEKDQATGRTELRLVSTRRTENCDTAKARTWAESVGVCGLCYARKREVIVPDLTAPELGTIQDLDGSGKPTDADRYKSVVGVPIIVGQSQTPWGVVMATSNRAKHFEVAEPGVQAAEGARAVAAMIALALAVLPVR